MLCHSVLSCHSPLLFLKRSLVARLNFPTGTPLGVYLTSGSAPTFPTRITLFMLFGICFSNRVRVAEDVPRRHSHWEVGGTGVRSTFLTDPGKLAFKSD